MDRSPNTYKDTHTLIGRQERYARYRGTVRVNLVHLRTDRVQQGLSLQRVEILKQTFATEGCHRLEPTNRIAALVSEQELTRLVLYSKLSPLTLLHGSDTKDKPPHLKLPADITLRVVHGRHRLEAAKSYLQPDDSWYMSSVLVTSLDKEYPNLKLCSDGEIFRQIRLCHRHQKFFQERKWWAFLRNDQSNDLKKIISVEELRECFDILLDVIGLWDGFRIGSIRWCLSLKCHKELSTYLRRIHYVWSKITNSNSRLMNLVDVGTVRCLESRAPAASTQDANFIKTCMGSGKIFAQVLDPGLRKTIIDNVCAVERTIPSLRTFLEDTKYLALCAKAMKIILEPHQRSTICEALREIYTGSNHGQQRLVRQDGESHFLQIETGDKDHFEFNYRQLWMYAMRHFSRLVSLPVEREYTRDLSLVQMPTSILCYRFAQLAFKLGFRSRKIQLMSSASALDNIVSGCISWVVGATKDGVSPERQVAEIRERLQVETHISPENSPVFITEDHDLDVQKRIEHYGVDSPQKSKPELFVRWLYEVEEPRGKYITSSFIRRAMFHAFFGHNVQSRSDGTIRYEQIEPKNLPQDEFPLSLPKDTYGQTWNAPKLGSCLIPNSHPSPEQGLPNTISPNFTHYPSSDCLDIFSPRNDGTSAQKRIANITMMLQESSQSRTCNSQEYNSVPTCCPASLTYAYDPPMFVQAAERKDVGDNSKLNASSLESSSCTLSATAALATPTGWKSNLRSPISPLTLPPRYGISQSILESGLDDAMDFDTETTLSTTPTSVSKIAPNSASTSFVDLKTKIAPDYSHALATCERDSINSERSSSSPDLGSHIEFGQERQSSSDSPDRFSDFDLPMAQIDQSESVVGNPLESIELIPSEVYPQLGQETLSTHAHAVTKPPTKRVREIVEESLSCVHDPVKPSVNIGERKTHKRSFQEYSTCLRSVDT